MQPCSCSCLHRKATVDVVFFFMPEMKSHSSSPAASAATGTAGRRQERKASDRNRKKENKKIEKIVVDSSSFFVDSFSRLLWLILRWSTHPTISLPFLSELVMSVGSPCFVAFLLLLLQSRRLLIRQGVFLFFLFTLLFFVIRFRNNRVFHHRHLGQKRSITSRQLGINRLFPVDWRQLLLERVECGCNCNDSRAIDDFLKIAFLDKRSLVCFSVEHEELRKGLDGGRHSSVVDANQALDPYLPIVH